MRQITDVCSHCDVKTGMMTVSLDVARETAEGTLEHWCTVTGKVEWDTKYDPHTLAYFFNNAYEIALAKIPKETIIEKCGGLKDGDWVCFQHKNDANNAVIWGIVFNDNILYMIGEGNYDQVSTFSNGESDYRRITTIVRPNHFPITYDVIHLGLYKTRYRDHCEIYTAD